MKMYCLSIAMYFSVLFAQFSTNDLNGFGSHVDPVSTFSESMGNMWMNNSNKGNWDPLLASSIYKTDLTMIAVSSSLGGNKTKAYNSNNYDINFINFSFPIRKNMGMGIGFSPYTRGNYIFKEDSLIIDGTEFSNPLLSHSSHVFEGGISKLSISLSKGIAFKSSMISAGFKWNVLFGNQKINSTTVLNEVSYDQQGNETLKFFETVFNDQYNHFKAYSYETDLRIKSSSNSLSFLITLMDNFEVDRDEANQLFSVSKKYLFNEIYLDRIGIGYMYNKNDNFGIAFEGQFKNSIDYPKEIMFFNHAYPSKISFHNGIYKRFENLKSGFWNSINLSAGYRYKIIKFTNKDLNDISFSLGAGIAFNESKNNIDIVFTIGSSQNIVETINSDTYYKLSVGIFSGDKWFKKRRRE